MARGTRQTRRQTTKTAPRQRNANPPPTAAYLSIDHALEYIGGGIHRETLARALRKERRFPGTGLRGVQLGGRGKRVEWRTTRAWIDEWLLRYSNNPTNDAPAAPAAALAV